MNRGGGLDEGMLRVTNYQNHPSNEMYKVFFFYKEEQANFFESLLIEADLFYERDSGEKNDEPIYLFGIKKKDLRQVYKLNDIAIGRFRNRLIPNKYTRIGIILFGLAVVTLAIIGYIKSH